MDRLTKQHRCNCSCCGKPPIPVVGGPAGVCPSYTTEQLFAGQRQIRLIHHHQEYRLTLTKTGKLILTK